MSFILKEFSLFLISGDEKFKEKKELIKQKRLKKKKRISPNLPVK